MAPGGVQVRAPLYHREDRADVFGGVKLQFISPLQ